jgi:hypothetical protein
MQKAVSRIVLLQAALCAVAMSSTPGAAALVIPEAAKCFARDAHYVLRGYPDVVAEFVRHRLQLGRTINGPLFLHIQVRSRNLSFWYVPDDGAGEVQNLVSMMDPNEKSWQAPDPDTRRNRPYEDQEFYAWNSDLSFRGFPSSTDSAPSLLFLPLLGGQFWGLPDRRFRVEQAFFQFDHCDGLPQKSGY